MNVNYWAPLQNSRVAAVSVLLKLPGDRGECSGWKAWVWEARLAAISEREPEDSKQAPLVYFQAGGEGSDPSLQVCALDLCPHR